MPKLSWEIDTSNTIDHLYRFHKAFAGPFYLQVGESRIERRCQFLVTGITPMYEIFETVDEAKDAAEKALKEAMEKAMEAFNASDKA